jgi:DNA-binding transcriptional regulator GbsR (MarR family)
MLSKQELYNEIIRLRQEGKTYREISKILHVSPSQISAALKEFEGTDTKPSMQTQAYRMFLDGKRPIDVAIALGLGNDQTTKLWKEYLGLTGHPVLLKIEEELGTNFKPFFNMYNMIKKRKLTLEDIEKGIKRARDIVLIDVELARKEKLSNELDEQIKERKNTIANLKLEVQTLGIVKMLASKIVEQLEREKKQLELFLQIHNARYNYQRNNSLVPIRYRSVQYY